MHKDEIARIVGKINEKGYTLVPLSLYFSGSLVKVEVALCKGKQSFDKKRTIADRDQKRALDRQLKEYR
jgi:SsrA-binding protein